MGGKRRKKTGHVSRKSGSTTTAEQVWLLLPHPTTLTTTMASSSAISGPIPPPRSLPVSEPTPASSSLALKYRGATVEDLQLSPAVSVPTTATVASALQVAFDHDYEQLPVLSSSNGNRKLLGYLDVKKLRADVEAGRVDKTKGVKENMVKFGGSGQNKSTYTLISPETGLGELEGDQ